MTTAIRPGTNPLFLLYRTGLAPTNGTSVYLDLVLKGRKDSIVHLMWDISEAGAESVEQVVVADDAMAWCPFPFDSGRGVYMRCRNRLGLNWWRRDQLNLAKLNRKLGTFKSRPRRAWVICMHEWDASRAYALWEGVGKPPFVLDVRDIFHDRLSEEETPKFRRLIREARHVLCVSANIAAEIRNNGAKSVGFLPFCSGFSVDGQRPFEPPLRIILSGILWRHIYAENPALKLLADSLPAIKHQFPGVELHYSGHNSKRLPDRLRGEIRDHGYLSHSAYEDLLRRCHVAYLPVSHPSTTVGRFSLPSRLADYLACGLPIIACTDKGTAIASFLQSLPEGCSANVANTTELCNAVARFAGDPLRWKGASATAREYAQFKLGAENARTELFRQLECLTAG
jgi:glycosyltransferase involved in cell wall biosynthesis